MVRRGCRRYISFLLVMVMVIAMTVLTSCTSRQATDVTEYMQEAYDTSVKTSDLYASKLCVLTDKSEAKDDPVDSVAKYALFDLDGSKTVTWHQAAEQLYPASTTKLMTALVALRSGRLDEMVTVSRHAIEDLEEGSSVCGLKVGDQLSLRDLLYGLTLESGNDAAVVIAEFLGGGSETDFVTMMNEEAQAVGATNSHFKNPHGLHDADHYTTVYDLYLIFTECLKYDEFKTIIESKGYNTSAKASDGSMRSINWEPTNYYAQGEAEAPTNIKIIGGKTGTTNEAGCCLVLLNSNKDEEPYISIVMGASDKKLLYADMNELMEMENN